MSTNKSEISTNDLINEFKSFTEKLDSDGGYMTADLLDLVETFVVYSLYNGKNKRSKLSLKVIKSAVDSELKQAGEERSKKIVDDDVTDMYTYCLQKPEYAEWKNIRDSHRAEYGRFVTIKENRRKRLLQ